ncbi:MAG: wax ester/triacylglycerol synthase domain-containing protein [Dermatophilaceae bacterium]
MQRLSSQDLVTFWPQLRGWPQDLGAVAVLDGAPLVDAHGELRLAAARDAIESSLHRVPRFRQVVHVPRLGLGRPLWVDAADFDIGEHVQVAPVAAPGDLGRLLAAVEAQRMGPLPPSRPLWALWLLPGLEGGRVGCYLRIHHAVADGPSALGMLGELLDHAAGASQEPASEPALSWQPEPVPTSGALFEDAWVSRCVAVASAARSALCWLAGPHHPLLAWHDARRAVTEMRAPHPRLNEVVGARRRILFLGVDLGPVRDLAHAHRATVNDVLLTAVTGGLRALLSGRGEDVATVVPRAMVPVSLRAAAGRRPAGNQLGSMVVPLPLAEPDPIVMLRALAADTRRRKGRTRPRHSPVLRSARMQRAALRMLDRQQVYQIYLADIPGPREPFSFLGARMRRLFPVVALMGNLTVGIGALSYAGQLNLSVVGDPDACPDLDVFADGVRATLGSLGIPVTLDSRS